MDPSFASVHGDLAGAYLQTGKYDLWIQEAETAFNLSHQAEYEAVFKEVGKVYAQSGIEAALREWAEQEVELSKRRYEDPALDRVHLCQGGRQGPGLCVAGEGLEGEVGFAFNISRSTTWRTRCGPIRAMRICSSGWACRSDDYVARLTVRSISSVTENEQTRANH
jgi:hypothetical protein